MNYIIQAMINPETQVEELLQVTDADLAQIEAFHLETNITAKLNFTVDRGVFVYPDGREVPFENFQAFVSGSFMQNGDRYWLTYDGGALNVSSMIEILREAVEGARTGAK